MNTLVLDILQRNDCIFTHILCTQAEMFHTEEHPTLCLRDSPEFLQRFVLLCLVKVQSLRLVDENFDSLRSLTCSKQEELDKISQDWSLECS